MFKFDFLSASRPILHDLPTKASAYTGQLIQNNIDALALYISVHISDFMQFELGFWCTSFGFREIVQKSTMKIDSILIGSMKIKPEREHYYENSPSEKTRIVMEKKFSFLVTMTHFTQRHIALK